MVPGLRGPAYQPVGRISLVRPVSRRSFRFFMRRVPRGIWPLLALIVATMPVAGVFTLSRIFFVRDLTMAFRSRFLFLRHAVDSGTFPLWDPSTATGQPAVNA